MEATNLLKLPPAILDLIMDRVSRDTQRPYGLDPVAATCRGLRLVAQKAWVRHAQAVLADPPVNDWSKCRRLLIALPLQETIQKRIAEWGTGAYQGEKEAIDRLAASERVLASWVEGGKKNGMRLSLEGQDPDCLLLALPNDCLVGILGWLKAADVEAASHASRRLHDLALVVGTNRQFNLGAPRTHEAKALAAWSAKRSDYNGRSKFPLPLGPRGQAKPPSRLEGEEKPRLLPLAQGGGGEPPSHSKDSEGPPLPANRSWLKLLVASLVAYGCYRIGKRIWASPTLLKK